MARGRSSGSSKGSLIQRPFTGGSWPQTMVRSMNSTGRQYPLVPGTIFHRGHDWNTIRDTMPPIYLTRTGIRSRLSIKASDGTSHRQGTYSTTTVVGCSSKWLRTRAIETLAYGMQKLGSPAQPSETAQLAGKLNLLAFQLLMSIYSSIEEWRSRRAK